MALTFVSDSTRDAQVMVFVGKAKMAALFTDDPKSSAGTEVSGGSPAYARKAVSWSGGSTGSAQTTLTFDLPAGTTVKSVGFFDSSGVWVGSIDITDQQFSGQGQLTIQVTYLQLASMS